MTEAELIETGRQWIEYAPPPADRCTPNLEGFRDPIQVCKNCASRIIGRGCNLRMLASEPVWVPDRVQCQICTDNSGNLA
jgi:hypothetical protein